MEIVPESMNSVGIDDAATDSIVDCMCLCSLSSGDGGENRGAGCGSSGLMLKHSRFFKVIKHYILF